MFYTWKCLNSLKFVSVPINRAKNVSASWQVKFDVVLEADICEQQGLSRYKCYGRAKIKAFSPSTAEFCYLSCCFSVRESKHSVLLLLLWFILPQKFIFHEYKRSSCLCEQNVHRIVTLTPMPRIWTNFHHSLSCSHWSKVKCVKRKFCRLLCLMNE